jgi:YjjG family noncanonical pyrimidine nucleotidase
MKYNLFLFDLDDTLLDFKESERLSFFLSLQSLGIRDGIEKLFESYQIENSRLWKLFELNQISKETLKVERFRRIFHTHQIEVDPELASKRYLDTLPETVVLVDYAVEICEWLRRYGEIGIITNGIQSVQIQRINRSKLAPYIHFVSVSEECGFAKPDVRIFEHSAKKATRFSKATSIMIGDRLEADILGAHNFGLDSCWFNPSQAPRILDLSPKYEIRHLSEIQKIGQ